MRTAGDRLAHAAVLRPGTFEAVASSCDERAVGRQDEDEEGKKSGNAMQERANDVRAASAACRTPRAASLAYVEVLVVLDGAQHDGLVAARDAVENAVAGHAGRVVFVPAEVHFVVPDDVPSAQRHHACRGDAARRRARQSVAGKIAGGRRDETRRDDDGDDEAAGRRRG